MDNDLAELMSWATTVVKLPLDKPRAEDLHGDIADFPAEFLIFSPHVGRLQLDDAERSTKREVLATSTAGTVVLTADGAERSWQVFKANHVRAPPRSRMPATSRSAGRFLSAPWALPDGGARGRGSFWAFFPTTMETTLSGIVNAPWKTNSDRQNLLQGAFNEELLDVLSRLVVDNLPALLRPDDPGRIFDVLPARGRETQSRPTEITDKIYEFAKAVPSVPDQTGRLMLPMQVRVAPETSSDALAAWESYEGRPNAWCHHTALTRERRPRVLRLTTDENVASFREWLEAIAADASPKASIAALKTIEAVLEVAEAGRRAHC